MNDIKNIFDISGRAMASQLVRLNTVASNLANAGLFLEPKKRLFAHLNPFLKQNLQTLLTKLVFQQSTLLELRALIVSR